MFIIWPLRYWNTRPMLFPSAWRTWAAMLGSTADGRVTNEIAATQSWPPTSAATGVWSHVSGNHGFLLWLFLPQHKEAQQDMLGRRKEWRWWWNVCRKKIIIFLPKGFYFVLACVSTWCVNDFIHPLVPMCFLLWKGAETTKKFSLSWWYIQHISWWQK